jgi:hypothetical protein
MGAKPRKMMSVLLSSVKCPRGDERSGISSERDDITTSNSTMDPINAVAARWKRKSEEDIFHVPHANGCLLRECGEEEDGHGYRSSAGGD